MTGRLAATILVICVLVPRIAAAQSGPPDMTSAEAAAWSAITAGKAANFNAMCGKIDPARVEPADPCRTIGHGFLETILTEPHWSGQIPREGVRIEGAFIRGLLDLHNAKIGSEVALIDSVLRGGLNLDRATLDPLLDLNGSTIGFLRGERVSIADNLWVRGATVDGPVNLLNAKFGNQVDFADSRFADAVSLDGASLGGDLMLSGAQFARILRLEDTHVGGAVSLLGAHLAEALLLERAQIDGDARLSGGTFAGAVSLMRANLRGDLILGMMPEALGQKRMPPARFQRALVLDRATIAGSMDIRQATFEHGIQSPSLHVGGGIDASDASLAGPWALGGAAIDGTLDLFGATLSDVDLAGASIGELGLAAPGRSPPHWTAADSAIALSLRNAHVGTLQDTIGAWPRKINLIGFTYDRLAGLGGRASSGELRPRSDEWWTKWLGRDPVYSPQPYRQLAGVLTLEGDNDTADAVRLAERQRARAEAWRHHRWGDWALLTVLDFTVGYGIGGAAFRVVYWVVGLALLGGLVLWLAPTARRKGGLWCVGASLSRLLPIIELNPEFTDFFNDPSRERLRGWQLIFFAVLGILGALLGSVLVAAISGLTQAS